MHNIRFHLQKVCTTRKSGRLNPTLTTMAAHKQSSSLKHELGVSTSTTSRTQHTSTENMFPSNLAKQHNKEGVPGILAETLAERCANEELNNKELSLIRT
jgi:hypothetical protein